MEWKKAEIKDLKRIYPRIPQDFAVNEYPQQEFMEQMMEQGLMEGMIFSRNGKECGYAFYQFGTKYRVVLLSLLAVFAEYRGTGAGQEILSLLKEIFQDWNGLYAEVEKPEFGENEQEKDLRTRRIRFYERSGFVQGIRENHYVMWGVPYRIMILPLKKPVSWLDDCTRPAFHDIYDKILAAKNAHRMVFDPPKS